MNAAYFNARERRYALLRWLRRTYGAGGMFRRREVFEGAKDIFTPLYDDERKCSSDLQALRGAGLIRHEGSQWQLTDLRGD